MAGWVVGWMSGDSARGGVEQGEARAARGQSRGGGGGQNMQGVIEILK